MIDGEVQEAAGVLKRLGELERANQTLSRSVRRLRLSGLGAATVLAVLLLAGAAAVSPCLEARNFVLRDESGKMCARAGDPAGRDTWAGLLR